MQVGPDMDRVMLMTVVEDGDRGGGMAVEWKQARNGTASDGPPVATMIAGHLNHDDQKEIFLEGPY
ncbi:hypothetical protein AKJ16_DCAP17386 [Drosera capensis]